MTPSRSGSNENRTSVPIRIEKDARDKLDIMSKRYKLPMKIINEVIIDCVYDLKIHPRDLKDYLEKKAQEANTYAFLDDACDALAHTSNKFVCIWYRPETPPKSKILGQNEEDAIAFCEACNKTRMIVEKIANYEEQIRRLDHTVKNGVTLKIPKCELGSELDASGEEFLCKRQGITVKVKRCMTLRSKIKQPCKDLIWITRTFKGQLADPEK